MNSSEPKKLHSAAYFTDHRDFWWNPDFLMLMATRWNVSKVKTILDVGCGQGHWGRALLPIFTQPVHLIGIDAEPKWIDIAMGRAATVDPMHKLEYRTGLAEKLPFDDDSFDLVTCQTVLIHVKDPLVALKEILRVLRPGGLIVAAEPNNAAPIITLDSVKKDLSLGDRLRMAKLQLTCDMGKEALGEGNNMRGDLLPHYFFSLGLEDVRSYLSDMADFYVPPYATSREKAGLTTMVGEIEKGNYMCDQAETKRYFLAGGGSEKEFNKIWHILGQYNQELLRQIKQNALCLPGGALFYLTSARKKKG